MLKKISILLLALLMVFSFVSCDDEVEASKEKGAKIGDKKYDTLAEAVKAAVDGDTIVLLDSEDGAGIIIEESKFATKGLTIDFGGNTYKAVKDPAGSTGTKSQAFQLLKGNKVVFKNGIVEDGCDEVLMVIQNYSDLTLDNIEVKGDANTLYLVSNNFGNSTYKNGTKLKAAEGCVAFDLWYCMSDSYADGVSVNIADSNVVIGGKVEIGKASKGTEENFKKKVGLTVPVDFADLDIVDSTKPATYSYIFGEAVDGFKTISIAITE